MSRKYHLQFSLSSFTRLATTMFVFLLTIYFMPFYIDGDQFHYRVAYQRLPAVGIIDGFSFYSETLASRELVHYLISWVASRFLAKDLFIAFSNAILAYVTMTYLIKNRVSLMISFLLVAANFYFMVLYFSAERMKFGFIFLVLSLMFIDQGKKFFWTATLAVVSHASIIIVYVSILFNALFVQIAKLLRTRKIRRAILFGLPFLLIPLVLVKDQVLDKLSAYYYVRDVAELGKIISFLVLALWYSDKKRQVFMLFIPLILAVVVVGGERVNLFGYVIFLYYGLKVRGGWNLGVLSTTGYFTYASVGFLTRVVETGHGF